MPVRLGRSSLYVGVVVVGVLAAAPVVAQRGRPAPGPFAAAKALTCSFPVYGAARWDGAAPQAISGTQEFSFRIEGIDYKKNQARIVAAGTVPVTVRLAETGLNVIEQTPIGNFTLTTVFSAGGDGKTFRAVHSRHIGETSDVPRTSQAYGTCDLTN
ncbi:MAG: hypothetical protein IT184_04760 [Acidobacteria bacterium]|nr:hypothetical protein [Acidobacteriota bacterium]